MLGGAAAGSGAGEAPAASCAHPGLLDPWEILPTCSSYTGQMWPLGFRPEWSDLWRKR